MANIFLVSPRGFCAGVDRAISIVERALELYGSPVYVKHEIVHNPHVVNRLRRRGAIFIEDLNDAPKGARLIFSAHGVSPAVRQRAKERELNVLDATCPLVTKVHKEALRFRKKQYQIIIIGHPEHVEVIGTMGHAPERMTVVSNVEDVMHLDFSADEPLAYLTQTTLSIDDTAEIIAALRKKFPHIEAPPKSDICYATTNRQNAVKKLTEKVDAVIVVGAPNSSNSKRLKEVALNRDVPAILISSHQELDQEWVRTFENIGVTAGASAPEDTVRGVVQALKSIKRCTITELKTVQEKTVFQLPAELKKAASASP